MVKEYFKNKLISLLFIISSIYYMPNPFKVYEYKQLIKNVKFSKNDVLLDIGCGNGLQTLLLGKKCKKIYGIDVDKKSISIARLRARYKPNNKCVFRAVKLENAAFRKEMFDKIFSICVIEHIPNYREVLEVAYKLLKKEGDMIFSVDAFENIEEKIKYLHKKNYHVERYFNKETILPILQKIGFKDINIFPIFKSDYAISLMKKGIMKDLKFGYPQTLFQYLLLKIMEKKSRARTKGIFLIIKCKK